MTADSIPPTAAPRARRAAAAAALLALIAATALPAAAKKPPPVVVAAAPIDPVAVFAALDTAIAAGRLDTAREIIGRSATQLDPAGLKLRVAELALAGDGLDEAATLFGESRADPAVAARANQGLGIVRLRQGRLAEAVTALDAALAADPKLVRAAVARGAAADRQRDWPQADTAYALALAADPRSAAALNNLGYSLLLRGRNAEAEANFAAALAIEPGLAAARTNLTFARALQGRYPDAFANSTPAQLAADLNTVGFAAMLRGDTAIAEAYFERAMKKNPRFDRTAWANLQYLQGNRSPMDALNEPAPAKLPRR